jgi:hypothetical protein
LFCVGELRRAARARRSHSSADREELLEPEGDQLRIALKGDWAGMLNAAKSSKRSPETGDLIVEMKLVAGACNRRYLQLWRGAA